MPYVFLKADAAAFKEGLAGAQRFSRMLPTFISIALHATQEEDGWLSLRDIKIKGIDSHPLDFNTKSVEIIIFAEGYPSGAENLRDREKYIEDRVGQAFPELRRNVSARVILADHQALGLQ